MATTSSTHLNPPMIHTFIEKLKRGSQLTRQEAESTMEELLSGAVPDDDIIGLLSAMRARDYGVEELVGFATVMRKHAQPVFSRARRPPATLLDTCGTGGDGLNTFNISTAAAFVVAASGAAVAKHGNRAISSKCGSKEVLEALGARIEIPLQRMGDAIRDVGFGFLFAPAVHTAMRRVMAARRQLGGRTIFNLLGPLTNPAGASAQVLGVFSGDVLELEARALAELGIGRAFVVHGEDGLDEISLGGETQIAEIRDGNVNFYRVLPQDFGLAPVPLAALRGGDAQTNAAIIRRIFNGEAGPARGIVLANASAALVAAGLAGDFREGVIGAAKSIDSGAARAKLSEFVAFTKQ
jgi:anthranilate phosphoribosyltransferase